LSGQVDWIEAPSPDAMGSITQRGHKIYFNQQPHVWPWQLSFAEGSPWLDKRVRQAANLCVDRTGLLKLLGGMMGVPQGTVPPGHPWWGNPKFEIKYDPDTARKLMAEQGVTADAMTGTGRGGRITKVDVLEQGSKSGSVPAAVAGTTKAALPQPSVPVNVEDILRDRPEQRVPMSRLRARIAERLVQSQQTAAILTTFNEVNMAPVMELRKKYQDKFEKEHGVRLGFMSFFVKAAVAALKKYPVLNASVDGNDIVYHGYFDIGIAVGSPRGLVVPILRDADQLSLAEIEKKIAEFGDKAANGKLSLEELTGGTFSISNGGVFGSMLSTPIINPPQSAILGIHATRDRPVAENGQVVIRPINYLALSYDHRIVDGREAVLGLVTMKEALEDPARMVLGI